MTAAWGALLRLARRDARQHPGRAALVVLLIALPVAGLVTAGTFTTTVRPTAAEATRAELGRADLATYPATVDSGTMAPPEGLPAGSRTEPLWRGELAITGSDGSTVSAIGVDLAGLGTGMLEVTGGQPPAPGTQSVALTAPLAQRLGVEVGTTVKTNFDSVRVVAILRDPMALDREAAVVPPDLPSAPSGYLVDVPSTTDATSLARDLERTGWDVATRADFGRSDSEETLLILVLGGFGFVVTCLVTAAAFAVSAQRRRHDLALLAAAGAESRHLRRSVSSSALLLGACGSAVGLLLGIAVPAATLPWLDSWTNRAIDGLVVSPVLLVAAGVVGVAVAVAAAWFTARAAGRTPVAAALTGRHPARTSSARLLVAGAAITTLGVLLTLATAGSAANSTAGNELLIAGGLLLAATLTMLGLGAMSPWLVEQLARRMGTRVPVGVRLAMRDTARFRSRTGPIVMAIVAGLGLSVAVGATVETVEAGLARDYRPQLAPDQLLVDGSAQVPLVGQLRETLPVEADGQMTIIQPVDSARGRRLPQVVTIAEPALLDAVGAPPSAGAALAAGEVLVLHEAGSAAEPATGSAELIAPDAVRVVELDLVPRAVPPVLLSPETLERSGAVPAREATRWLVRLSGPIDDTQLQQARELATRFEQRVTVETGPPAINSGAIQAAVLAGAGALSLLIVGVGLALLSREARHDDSVLTCVGASPRSRRSLAAARAATLTFLGGVLAVPAGLLPIWGLSASRVGGVADQLSFPGPSIVAVVAVVPAVAAAAAWLLTRPAPANLTPQDA